MAVEAREHATTRSDSDAAAWAERCGFWLDKHDKARRKRYRKQREDQPLILTGHGVSIRVERGTLSIRDGNTHYPAEVRTHRYFRGSLDTPRRIVVVDGGGEITFDALDWMHEQDVTFLRLDWTGKVISVASPTGYAADPERVAWQRETASIPEKAIAFAADIICAKLAGTIETLENALPDSTARAYAVERARLAIERLRSTPPKNMASLLLVEAREALNYFRAWKGWTMSWRDKKHPVPRSWDAFEQRSVENDLSRGFNKDARHPINAILNYAYGVLETRVRIDAIAKGYDPTIGVLHTSSEDKASFVFDLMEPERPRVDAAVLHFLMGRRFSGADFTIRGDGVCRLNPEMARALVTQLRLPGK